MTLPSSARLPGRPTRSAYARRKPPTPTPCAGWSSAIRIPLPDQRRAIARDRVEPARDFDSIRSCAPAARKRDREDATSTTSASAARCPQRQTSAATTTRRRQSDEARLREREEAARPTWQRSRRRSRRARRRATPSRMPRERGEDRDDEVAAVDRRIPEDRVDAEERRVRVPDDHLRVPEDVARRPLVEADVA